MNHTIMQNRKSSGPRRWALTVGAMLVSITLWNAPAQAQSGTLPATLTGAGSISADQQDKIEAFVTQAATDALSDSHTARRRGRNALLKPLSNKTKSISFRRAYAQSVVPVIEQLVASEDMFLRSSGLRIAGELGTDRSAQLLIDQINTDDAGIRLFVIGRLGRTLVGQALSPATAVRVIDTLGQAVEDAPSAVEADAGVRALGQAASILDSRQKDTRFEAVRVIARSMGDRLRRTRSSSPEAKREIMAALRAVNMAHLAVADETVDTPPEAAKMSARLGADAIGFFHSRLRSEHATADSQIDIQLLAAGENLLYAAYKPAKPGNKPTLRETIVSGDDRTFRTKIATLIGPASAFVDRFKFDPNRFLRPEAED